MAFSHSIEDIDKALRLIETFQSELSKDVAKHYPERAYRRKERRGDR